MKVSRRRLMVFISVISFSAILLSKVLVSNSLFQSKRSKRLMGHSIVNFPVNRTSGKEVTADEDTLPAPKLHESTRGLETSGKEVKTDEDTSFAPPSHANTRGSVNLTHKDTIIASDFYENTRGSVPPIAEESEVETTITPLREKDTIGVASSNPTPPLEGRNELELASSNANENDTATFLLDLPLLDLSADAIAREERERNTPSVNSPSTELSAEAVVINGTSLKQTPVEDNAVQDVRTSVEDTAVRVVKIVETLSGNSSGIHAKNSSSSASSEEGTPLLTFYLHGGLSVRLASYAIGAAFAKRHGYNFRAVWEKDGNCSLSAEDIFETTGNTSHSIISMPAGDLPPNFAECGQDLTPCLRANRSIAYRGLYRDLPPLQDGDRFRPEARRAFETLSLNPAWAKHYVSTSGPTREYVMVLFASESDRGLETVVEAARFVEPLIDSVTRALLQPNGTALSVFVLSSHQSVLDALRTFFRRELQQFLFLNTKSPTYSLLSTMWRALGRLPNFRVNQVIESSPGLLAPSLVALLPPSVKHTEIRCFARQSPQIRVSKSKDRGALYIADVSKKDVEVVGGATPSKEATHFSMADGFFLRELGRSVGSMKRIHNNSTGVGPLPVAVFSDQPVLASTQKELSHFFRVNVSRALGNYEVAHAVASRASTSLAPKRIAKIKHLAQSPFELTLYLDTDTVVCGSLQPCFSLLENSEYDMLLGQESEGRTWNSGVILYRRSAAMEVFLRLWEHVYMFDCVLPGQKNQDQCALSAAIELLPSLKVGLLPSKCHVLLFNEDWEQGSDGKWERLHSQLIPKGEAARLLHNRHFNETYYQSAALCEFVNKEVGRERVLGFHKDGRPRMYFDAKECQLNTMQGCNKVQFSRR